VKGSSYPSSASRAATAYGWAFDKQPKLQESVATQHKAFCFRFQSFLLCRILEGTGTVRLSRNDTILNIG